MNILKAFVGRVAPLLAGVFFGVNVMPNTKNEIIKDHGDWVEVDMSTKKHPSASMYLDKDIWLNMPNVRISPQMSVGHKYIKAVYNLDNKRKSVHHAVLPKKDGHEVDHICHGTSSFVDNRRSNLRYATPSQNQMNKGLMSSNTSGMVGVRWVDCSQKWVAMIRINGRKTHLGCFDNVDFAVGARKQAEREHFGEFAYGG